MLEVARHLHDSAFHVADDSFAHCVSSTTCVASHSPGGQKCRTRSGPPPLLLKLEELKHDCRGRSIQSLTHALQALSHVLWVRHPVVAQAPQISAVLR